MYIGTLLGSEAETELDSFIFVVQKRDGCQSFKYVTHFWLYNITVYGSQHIRSFLVASFPVSTLQFVRPFFVLHNNWSRETGNEASFLVSGLIMDTITQRISPNAINNH